LFSLGILYTQTTLKIVKDRRLNASPCSVVSNIVHHERQYVKGLEEIPRSIPKWGKIGCPVPSKMTLPYFSCLSSKLSASLQGSLPLSIVLLIPDDVSKEKGECLRRASLFNTQQDSNPSSQLKYFHFLHTPKE
jgi:hypothetical protein